MMTVLAVSAFFFLNPAMQAQSAVPAPAPSVASNLSAILTDLQRTTQAANSDIGKLRIEKWKGDDARKQELQRVAESLQKNISMAIPSLITETQAAPGRVSNAFKLYDDVTVVYGYLRSLADAANTYGKKEEYSPLAGDVSALADARKSLATYIDQTATNLELQAQKPATPQHKPEIKPNPKPGPKKIVIDDDTPSPAKAKKKKPSPVPSPTPSPSSATSPPR